MTKQTLRTLLLSGLAVAGVSIAAPAMAALPLGLQFTLTESTEGSSGRYTVTNNSASWYIYGFQVTNPFAYYAGAYTDQDNWYAYNCGSGCSNGDGGDPYFSYFNGGGSFDFAHNLAPGVTSNHFTFNATPASHYTLFLSNQEQQTTTVSGDTGVPEPAVWSMMIMGFGLAGAAMRRRRALPTPA